MAAIDASRGHGGGASGEEDEDEGDAAQPATMAVLLGWTRTIRRENVFFNTVLPHWILCVCNKAAFQPVSKLRGALTASPQSDCCQSRGGKEMRHSDAHVLQRHNIYEYGMDPLRPGCSTRQQCRTNIRAPLAGKDSGSGPPPLDLVGPLPAGVKGDIIGRSIERHGWPQCRSQRPVGGPRDSLLLRLWLMFISPRPMATSSKRPYAPKVAIR